MSIKFDKEHAPALWIATATVVQICATIGVPVVYHSRIDGLLLPAGR